MVWAREVERREAKIVSFVVKQGISLLGSALKAQSEGNGNDGFKGGFAKGSRKGGGTNCSKSRESGHFPWECRTLVMNKGKGERGYESYGSYGFGKAGVKGGGYRTLGEFMPQQVVQPWSTLTTG